METKECCRCGATKPRDEAHWYYAKVQFDNENDAAFKAAWSLPNLAPLWAFDNNQKHDRLDWVLPATYVNQKLRAMYDAPACAHLVAA